MLHYMCCIRRISDAVVWLRGFGTATIPSTWHSILPSPVACLVDALCCCSLCLVGMESCQEIGNARTDKKTDVPYEDIKIINVSVK